MAETYGFFDSENHDRPYTSAQMSQYFQGIVTNGVFDGIGKNLVPYISGPYVKIPSGRAVVDWHWYNNDDTVALNFPITSGSVRCILVLACDYIQRKIYPQIKQGTSVNLPDVTDTENIKYLKLAYLQVSASTATITKICIGDETPLLKNLTEFVVKEDGKSLSTNDFTDEYKSQIDTNTSGIDELKSRADAVDVNVSDLSDKVKQNTADTEQLKSKTDATDEVVGHLSKSLQNAVFKSNVDTELSTTSENPVQNKVVSANINSLTASVNYMSEHKADTTTVNGVISDVSKLNDRVTANETAINSNTSNINAVDARVDSLFEADVQFNKDIASVNTTATIAKTKAETALARNEFTDAEKSKLAGITNPMVIKGTVASVSDLPSTAEIGWFYFVGASDADVYDEYCYSQNGWEYVGTSQEGVDLSNYYTKSDVNTKINEVNTNTNKKFATLEAQINGTSGAVAELQSEVDNFTGVQRTTNASLWSCIQANAENIAINQTTLGYSRKNLFNFADAEWVNQSGSVTVTKKDESITIKSLKAWAAAAYKLPELKTDMEYTFSVVISDFARASTATDTQVRIRLSYDVGGTKPIQDINITSDGAYELIFTPTSKTVYVIFYPNYSSTVQENKYTASEIMLRFACIENGTYESYKPTAGEHIVLNKTTLGYQKKNLCPVNSKTMSANGWVMGGSGTDVYKVYIPKGKYILTFKQTAIGQSEIQFFNSTNTQITRVLPYASTENSSLKFTITLSEDCYGMKFYNNSGVNTYSNIMIRDAAITDTTFEPYVESVDERLNKFTSQSQLYSNTTDGSSPLTVTVSNLFAEYSAVICNVVTSSGKYSLTLPLRYIKSLGTSAYYEAEGLLFYYVDDSTMTVKTGLGQSNPTINSIKIIKLY